LSQRSRRRKTPNFIIYSKLTISSSAFSETAHAQSTVASSATASPSATASGSGWGVLDDFLGADSSSATGSNIDVGTKTSTESKRPQPTGEELRERLNEDLRSWQSKFATAADKGAEDLETRVAEITERQIQNGVHGHGAALIVQLEETAESTVSSFKTFIQKTVKALPENPTEEDYESAYEKCVAKTRDLGLSVKERAQAVRSWKATYDVETDSLVRAAVSSTVEVLEKIYGLGLQEVGMRWAWLDGVTYQDWQKYHKLRNTLTEWQAEVEAVGTRHEGLKVAHDEATKLEDKAMSTASTMVSELVRLKDVSKWKIWAEDASNDFSNKKVPVKAYNAAQQVIKNAQDASSKASEAVVGSETPATESIASAVKQSVSVVSSRASEAVVGSETPATESVASAIKQSASDASSKISDAIIGSETPVTESIASAVKSQASQASSMASEAVQAGESAASKAPKKVFGGVNAQVVVEAREPVFDQPLDDDEETYSEKVNSMVSEAGDRASELSRAISEALMGRTRTQGTVESVTSLASEEYAKALAAASSVLYGTEQQTLESATSVASLKFAQAVTA
jgi:hypothetical protein